MDSRKRINIGLAWLREALGAGFQYVWWDGGDLAKECPICCDHDKDGKYYGGNCIWFSSAYLHHGMGLEQVKCAANGMLGGNSAYMRILLTPYNSARSFIDSKLGKGRFRLIRKNSRGRLTEADLEAGDVIFYYRGLLFHHAAVYIGEGRIIDCAIEPGGVSERGWDIPYPCRAAIRYVGE